MYNDFADKGLMTLALYSETDSGALPTAEDLMGWANQYGIKTPVLADDAGIYWEFGTGSLPSMALLGPGMEVLAEGWVDEGTIEEFLGPAGE